MKTPKQHVAHIFARECKTLCNYYSFPVHSCWLSRVLSFYTFPIYLLKQKVKLRFSVEFGSSAISSNLILYFSIRISSRKIEFSSSSFTLLQKAKLMRLRSRSGVLISCCLFIYSLLIYLFVNLAKLILDLVKWGCAIILLSQLC